MGRDTQGVSGVLAMSDFLVFVGLPGCLLMSVFSTVHE